MSLKKEPPYVRCNTRIPMEYAEFIETEAGKKDLKVGEMHREIILYYMNNHKK